MSTFDHERLNVYHVALDFIVVVEDVVAGFWKDGFIWSISCGALPPQAF
jgi:hypothetical protein